MSNNKRIEKDSLGEVEIIDQYYWGAQTQRALNNFKIGSEIMPLSVIKALALIKQTAAKVNYQKQLISKEISEVIIKVCDEIISEKLNHHFPLTIWQSGSGTQSNMNLNEVIASRANEILTGTKGGKTPVHPNDHVNCSQSSNDVFPSAMHIATIFTIKPLVETLKVLKTCFDNKTTEFKKIIKIGRTHLQDATPVTLGQEFSAYSFQIEQATKWINNSLTEVYQLAIGGTAVGTGINAPKDFGIVFAQQLAKDTKLPFTSCPNKFSALATNDSLVNLSGSLNTLAVTLNKIINDLRLLASGPRSGIGELSLPSNEPGSSIMPGKVNPTQIEALTMVCFQVMANHNLITQAGTNGHLQLNVYRPILIFNLLQAINLLNNGITSFINNCLVDIKVNQSRIKELLDSSLMLVTMLNKHIGYDQAAKIANLAYQENITLKQATVKLAILSEQEFDKIMIIENMI